MINPYRNYFYSLDYFLLTMESNNQPTKRNNIKRIGNITIQLIPVALFLSIIDKSLFPNSTESKNLVTTNTYKLNNRSIKPVLNPNLNLL